MPKHSTKGAILPHVAAKLVRKLKNAEKAAPKDSADVVWFGKDSFGKVLRLALEELRDI